MVYGPSLLRTRGFAVPKFPARESHPAQINACANPPRFGIPWLSAGKVEKLAGGCKSGLIDRRCDGSADEETERARNDVGFEIGRGRGEWCLRGHNFLDD